MLRISGHSPAQRTPGPRTPLVWAASQEGSQQAVQAQARSGARQPVAVRAAAGFAIPAKPQPSPGRLWSRPQPRVADKTPRQQESKVAASSKSAHSNSRPQHTGTGISLFAPYENLPPDGQTRTEGEAACDPETQRCKSVMHTWESKCTGCSGTGLAKSRGGRRGSHASLVNCIMCHGAGYLRHTSARVLPDLGNGAYLTLGRQHAPAKGAAADVKDA